MRIAGPAIALILLVLSASAGAQEQVRVRGWAHPDYGRIVFDWPKPVRYDAEISGGTLQVRFERPLTAEFERALELLVNFVSGAELAADGRTASFRLKGDFGLKTFANDSSVVVDLVRKKVTSEPVGAPATAAAPERKEPGAGQTAPLLNVRTGEHPDYDRLVFDWTRPTDYNLKHEGTRVSIRFDRPARIELAELRARLGEGFKSPEASLDGNSLVFTVEVSERARLRHFRAGTKVVLDTFKSTEDAGKTKAEKNNAEAPEHKAPATPAKPQAEQAAQLPKAPPARKDGPIRLVPKTDGNQAAKSVEKPDKSSESKPSAEPKPVATANEARAEVPAESKAAAPRAGGEGQAEEKQNDDRPAPDPVTLAFDWSEPVPAAVFRRNKYVWIVFGRRTPLDTAPLVQQSRSLIDRIDQIPSGQATVIRVQTKDDRINVAAVQLNRTNWLVKFALSPMQPNAPVPLGVSGENDAGTGLRMTLPEDSQLITFQDPDIGDAIQSVLLMTPGLGIDGERAYPEFQILASAQGVGIVGFNDQVELKKEGASVVVTSPSGLFVSKVASVPSKLKAGAKVALSDMGTVGPQILKPVEWQREGSDKLTEIRQSLLEATISQSPNRRATGRTELARFNFSLGFAEEALGILDVVEFTDLEAASDPAFVALKGAALALADAPDEARKSLSDPRLDEYQDVALWRGYAADLGGDAETAAEEFDKADPALQAYPYPLKAILLVRRLAVAIDQENLAIAKQWRDRITDEQDKFRRPYKARLNYQLGRLYRKELDLDNAVAAFQTAKESKDLWSQVRAEYDLVDLGLQQETLAIPEAVRRLERLRYAWRGDGFERMVLRRLANIYLSAGDYRNGLNMLKVIVTYFPNEPDAKEATQEMGEIFRRLYLDGEADNMSPLKALALYDEFRELTPAGPDGNLMIQFLAERLVNVDLLDKASDVLGHQVKFRLKGEEKAAVGTKLALIRLIARDPQGAIAALRDSFYPNISVEIENDRRRIRAKAEFELGKAEDAIALLAGDISREADMLRSAIYFRERNWGEAGKVYQRLVGDPPSNGATFPDDAARTVLLWAVALKLNRDEDGLRQLFTLYGPAMRATPLAATFSYIAKPSEGSGFDLGSIQKQIADVDQFQAFLSNYRERLLKTGPARKKGAKDTAKAPETAAGESPPKAGRPSG